MSMYILMHFFHFMEKGPYFHKLGPLLSPKVFVTLGKIKVTWQKKLDSRPLKDTVSKSVSDKQ